MAQITPPTSGARDQDSTRHRPVPFNWYHAPHLTGWSTPAHINSQRFAVPTNDQGGCRRRRRRRLCTRPRCHPTSDVRPTAPRGADRRAEPTRAPHILCQLWPMLLVCFDQHSNREHRAEARSRLGNLLGARCDDRPSRCHVRGLHRSRRRDRPLPRPHPAGWGGPERSPPHDGTSRRASRTEHDRSFVKRADTRSRGDTAVITTPHTSRVAHVARPNCQFDSTRHSILGGDVAHPPSGNRTLFWQPNAHRRTRDPCALRFAANRASGPVCVHADIPSADAIFAVVGLLDDETCF